MKQIFLFLIAGTMLASSCGFIGGKKVHGDGNWKTDERSVGSFDEVQVSGAIDVYVSQGAAQPVKIETDANLMEYVEVNVEGSRLVIKTRNGYNLDPTQEMKVYVTAPLYKSIQVSGACDVIGQNEISSSGKIDMGVSGAGEIKMEISSPEVTVDLTGAGAATLRGQTKKFDISLSGAGHIRCFDLKSETTEVDITGAGEAEVFASVAITGSISGAGSVHYKGGGSPSVNTTGAGSVHKAD